jgi:hypothetical protein
MNKGLMIVGLGLSLVLGSAHAAQAEQAAVAASAAAASQSASSDAKTTKPVSEKVMAQRAKMKACNGQAREKALKGADRKAFMKTCLSNKA